jgi:5-(aminomethyl)-3-furanmethanol phosphate kinase
VIVVKVSGSLFDWPELRPRLHAWFDSREAAHILLVPGGAATADAVRELDRTHQLGEETSHWLAIQALSLNARFLLRLFPEAAFVGTEEEARRTESRLAILDPHPFFVDDENRHDHLPHDWEVTSDSLAVRVAALVGAVELILLKSTTWEGANWQEASDAGVVDGYFPQALLQASGMPVRLVNLRTATI